MQNNVKLAVVFFASLVISFMAFRYFGDKKQEKKKMEVKEESSNIFSLNAEDGEEKVNIEINNVDGIKEAVTELKESLQELNDGEEVETVDFRDLKDQMPKRINGLERTDFSGEKAGALGFKIAKAEAIYKGDDGERLEVNIVDLGNASIAVKGLASWSELEIDKESEYGYERTTTIDGHQAYEKYNSKSRSGETSILVADRFLVNIKGRKVDEKSFTKAIRALDIEDLEDLI